MYGSSPLKKRDSPSSSSGNPWRRQFIEKIEWLDSPKVSSCKGRQGSPFCLWRDLCCSGDREHLKEKEAVYSPWMRSGVKVPRGLFSMEEELLWLRLERLFSQEKASVDEETLRRQLAFARILVVVSLISLIWPEFQVCLNSKDSRVTAAAWNDKEEKMAKNSCNSILITRLNGESKKRRKHHEFLSR